MSARQPASQSGAASGLPSDFRKKNLIRLTRDQWMPPTQLLLCLASLVYHHLLFFPIFSLLPQFPGLFT